jgi:two-component system sensor histidine kinase/response regulator
MSWFDERFLGALEPKQPEDPESVRFIIRAWMWAAPFLVFLLSLYIANGWRMQVAAQLCTLSGGALALFALRRGAKPSRVANASFALATVDLCVSALAQTPYDPSSIQFMIFIPIAAAFIGGLRQGAFWACVITLSGLVTFQLGARGFSYRDVDPSPLTTMSLNFAFTVVVTMALVKTYTDARDRALHEARAADRAKSVFLANVSHEIRTPMNGVVGMTEVLLQGDLTGPQRSQLEVIQRSGQSLVLLINDLLDLARLEEGRLVLLSVRFDLNTLIADIARLYRPLASAKGITLNVSVAPELPRMVQGDALRLRQVLSNLLSNAVKFTPRGSVTLEVTRSESGTVSFAVSDTGPGISAAALPRLFQRFEQGDASATRRAGGTGLGLALSREFVALMGGTLELDPAHSPGSRFTFSVSLPIATSPSPIPQTTPVPPGGAAGCVLVVDDNPINLAVARSLVSNAGFQVKTASNGVEALAVVQSAELCLVLMDVQMPEMDGLEATRLIRAMPGERGRLPVVGLTAAAMPEDILACHEAGMEAVLSKPINRRALAEVLARHSVVPPSAGAPS